jgi:hypothetical protein
MAWRSRAEKQGKERTPEGGEILAEAGGVKISESDVDRAIREARERVGNEFAELLEAPTMTQEEMDAIDGDTTSE